MTPTSRSYAHLALLSLAVTVAAGVWLRSIPLWPSLLGGVAYGNAVHAHSHLALFGWATMGLMAAIVARIGDRASPRLRWHAWAVGGASGVAFLAFLQQGYGVLSIVISTLQVVLWVVFVAAVWRRTASLHYTTRLWVRAALGCLMVAAAGSILPGAATATGASHAVQRIAVELFLTVVIQGWLFIGALAILVRPGPRARWHGPALAMLLSGMLPAVLTRVPGVESEPLLVLGRTGLLLTGAGSLLVAWSAWPRRDAADPARVHAWLRLALACVAVKGASELVAAAEPAGMLVLLRPVVIAYLHLVLLGALTSALVVALVPPSSLVARSAPVHAAGLALTLGALGMMALPDLLGRALPFAGRPMYAVAFTGGVLSAASLGTVVVASLVRGWRERAVRTGSAFGTSPAPALD